METRGSGSSDPECLSRMMSFHGALPDRTEETGRHLSWDCAEDADNGKQPLRSLLCSLESAVGGQVRRGAPSETWSAHNLPPLRIVHLWMGWSGLLTSVMYTVPCFCAPLSASRGS